MRIQNKWEKDLVWSTLKFLTLTQELIQRALSFKVFRPRGWLIKIKIGLFKRNYQSYQRNALNKSEVWVSKLQKTIGNHLVWKIAKPSAHFHNKRIRNLHFKMITSNITSLTLASRILKCRLQNKMEEIFYSDGTMEYIF